MGVNHNQEMSHIEKSSRYIVLVCFIPVCNEQREIIECLLQGKMKLLIKNVLRSVAQQGKDYSI